MNKLLIIKNNSLEISLIAIYVTIGILTRTVFHIGENVEFVTGLSIASGYFFRNKKLSFVVPFLIMLLSDLILKNSIVFLFTWSGFLLAPLFKYITIYFNRKFKDTEISKKLVLSSSLSGVVFTLFYFLWTNAGVVMVSDMYSKDLSGLIQSYINGLPFLYNQLIGNVVITPMVFLLTYSYIKFHKNFNYNFSLKLK